MKLSVIIPAYNTHDLTAAHVRECMASTTEPDEIIVVNDGGTPDLREKLIELKADTTLIYARINENILWNYNGAYNLGVWLSTGDILALEDSDHIPTRELYQNAISALIQPSVGRLGVGRILVSLEDVMSRPMREWVQGRHLGTHENSTIIRRNVFLRMKGNDEQFSGRYGWIGYDWKRRRERALEELNLTTGRVGSYFLVYGGECPDVPRGMSKENYQFLRRNTRASGSQHKLGILNFTYTHEYLYR